MATNKFEINKSIFKVDPNLGDNMIISIRNRTKLTYSILDAFASSDTELLTKKVSNYLLEFTLNIREKYIENNNITGLKNNLFIIETLMYASKLIKVELLHRGFEERIIKFILKEAIDEFLMVEKLPSNSGLSKYIFEMVCQQEDPNEFSLTYAIRLYITNQKGLLSQYHFMEEPIFEEIFTSHITEDLIKKCTNTNELSYMLLNSIADEVYNEIGHIPLDSNLQRQVKDTVNNVYQFAKEHHLM